MKKILIIDDMHDSIGQLLAEKNYSFDYFPKITRSEIFNLKDEYEGIFVRSKIFLDTPFFDHFRRLNFIGRAGAGVDLIDLDEVNKRKIRLFNAPEGNRDALAEHSLALLLAVMNNLTIGHQEIELLLWKREENRGYELNNLTVGLVGYGYMGMAFAQRLKALGCNILAYDKYKTDFSDEIVTESSMEEIFEKSDVFTIHVPLNDETDFMLNDQFFNSFKKKIWFLNTSRGRNLKTSALLNAIKTGKVLGAGLDVLENEKPETWDNEMKSTIKSLFESKKCIFSPHVGGWTFESYRKINEVLVSKI